MIIILMAAIKEKANAFIVQELEARHIRGILPAHGSILHLLIKIREPISMTDLAKKTGRAKSTITVMVNKLIKEGYLTKVRCSNDSRFNYISPSKKLLTLAKDLEDISCKLIKKTYKNMSDVKQEKLIRLLNELNQNFENE